MSFTPWLIALDLDGTILNENKTISPRTKRAIQAAVEEGHHVVIATGRPPRSARVYYDELQLTTPFITLNGTFIDLPAKRQVLLSEGISRDIANQFVHMAKQFDVQNALIETATSFILYRREGYDTWFPPEMFAPGYTPVGSSDALDLPIPFDPAAMIFRIDPQYHSEFFRLAQPLATSQVSVRAWSDLDDTIEILPKNVSKASALAFVCQTLGVDRNHVLAFGDEMNDLQMLRYARIGVVMGNANPNLLPVADYVTLDCNHDGVAAYLERHLDSLALDDERLLSNQ